MDCAKFAEICERRFRRGEGIPLDAEFNFDPNPDPNPDFDPDFGLGFSSDLGFNLDPDTDFGSEIRID
jgi:hypothetical protein